MTKSEPKTSETKPEAASKSKPESVATAEATAKVEATPKNVAQSETRTSDAILATLEAAAKGLLYISETDAPLTPFFWPSEDKTLAPEMVLQLAKLPEKTEITTKTLEEFFEPVAREEDWMNADEKAEAQKFQELSKVLNANLSDIMVYRAGETSIDVFIVGKIEGSFAGLATKVVET